MKALITADQAGGLKAGDIELAASMLEVYDDLWPMDHYKQYLQVTQDEAAQKQAAISAANRRRLHKKQRPGPHSTKPKQTLT